MVPRNDNTDAHSNRGKVSTAQSEQKKRKAVSLKHVCGSFRNIIRQRHVKCYYLSNLSLYSQIRSQVGSICNLILNLFYNVAELTDTCHTASNSFPHCV